MKARLLAVATLLCVCVTAGAKASTYVYTLNEPPSADGLNQVAQFSLSSPLGGNTTVDWSIYGPPTNPFPSVWLGGTITLTGAGAPANFSVPVTAFSADTNAAGQIIDWFIYANVYLPNNTGEQAYSINSLAGVPPAATGSPGIDYYQATIIACTPSCTAWAPSTIMTFGRRIDPSGLDSWSVAATPLPAALPLFATGLGGLGLLGWRRRRKSHAAVA
jgi:hypothetical protein